MVLIIKKKFIKKNLVLIFFIREVHGGKWAVEVGCGKWEVGSGRWEVGGGTGSGKWIYKYKSPYKLTLNQRNLKEKMIYAHK